MFDEVMKQETEFWENTRFILEDLDHAWTYPDEDRKFLRITPNGYAWVKMDRASLFTVLELYEGSAFWRYHECDGMPNDPPSENLCCFFHPELHRVHVRLKIIPVDACIKIVDDDSIVRHVLEIIGE